jgi:nucleotide-binding universal stress UspA family protein
MLFASTPSNPVGLEQSIEREARRIAGEGVRLACICGFDGQSVAERGDPIWQRIVQSPEENDASIVVVGAHGRTPSPPNRRWAL